MNDASRKGALLPWLFPVGLVIFVVVTVYAPGWVQGAIGIVVLGGLGFGGLGWYSRRYRRFHDRG